MNHTWILILTYKYPEGLERLLDSLKLTTNENYTIIVILNGVNEEDYKFVFKRKNIEIIKLEKNLGFFKAYNKAILDIPIEDHFVVLNDDVEILNGRWLTAMYDKMYDQTVPSNQDPHTWSYQKIGIVGYRQEARLTNNKGQKENQTTDRWILSCALVNPKAIRVAGIFDERYYCWWGDFEFLCRLHGAGYKLLTVHEKYIYHERQHTFKELDDFNSDTTWPFLDALEFYEQCYNRHFEWKEAMPFPIEKILTEAKWYIRRKLIQTRNEVKK